MDAHIAVITFIPCLHGMDSSFPTQLLQTISLLIFYGWPLSKRWTVGGII